MISRQKAMLVLMEFQPGHTPDLDEMVHMQTNLPRTSGIMSIFARRENSRSISATRSLTEQGCFLPRESLDDNRVRLMHMRDATKRASETSHYFCVGDAGRWSAPMGSPHSGHLMP